MHVERFVTLPATRTDLHKVRADPLLECFPGLPHDSSHELCLGAAKVIEKSGIRGHLANRTAIGFDRSSMQSRPLALIGHENSGGRVGVIVSA